MVYSKTPMSPEAFQPDNSCECGGEFFGWAFVPCLKMGALYDEKITPCHGEKKGNNKMLVTIASCFVSWTFALAANIAVQVVGMENGKPTQTGLAIMGFQMLAFWTSLFVMSSFLFNDVFASGNKPGLCNFCCCFGLLNACWLTKLAKHAEEHGGPQVGAPVGAYGAGYGYGSMPAPQRV